METTDILTKVLHPADYQNWNRKTWPIFVKVHYRIMRGQDRLSITGVMGPKRNGDSDGGCGQISLPEVYQPAPGWTVEMVERLWELWDRWHLNDLRAGCEHQRDIDVSRMVEVVRYGLTTEAFRMREKALTAAARAGALGESANLTETAKALALLDDWYKDRTSPPDADSPLSGCFEVKKREQKAIGWLTPDEHPNGMLERPCAVCGYKYGTAWLHEPVPAGIIAELRAFPDGDLKPAWV